MMILLMVGGVFALDSSGATFPEYLLYIPMAACFALFLALYSWLWNAPVRALKTRQVEASGRTKDEARRLALQRVTWGQLGIGALAAPLVLLRVGARQNLLVGWSRLWILAAVLLLILVGVQAVRKWRIERGSPGKVD